MGVVLLSLTMLSAQAPVVPVRPTPTARSADKMICGPVRETGSRISRRVCVSAEEMKLRNEAAERSITRLPYSGLVRTPQ